MGELSIITILQPNGILVMYFKYSLYTIVILLSVIGKLVISLSFSSFQNIIYTSSIHKGKLLIKLQCENKHIFLIDFGNTFSFIT
jgi:hypothetical protein